MSTPPTHYTDEPKFAISDAQLPDSDMYMLPCLCGAGPLKTHLWQKLLEKINDGATLYISNYDGWLSNLHDIADADVVRRSFWKPKEEIVFCDDSDSLSLPEDCSFSIFHRESGINQVSPLKYILKPLQCKVIATDGCQNPVLTVCNYGKGKVFFLNYGLEMILAKNIGVFENSLIDYAKIYRLAASEVIEKRPIQKDSKDSWLCVTFHPLDNNESLCVAVNHSFETKKARIRLNKGYSIRHIVYGQINTENDFVFVNLAPGEGCVIRVSHTM